jgi:hypothetical protein
LEKTKTSREAKNFSIIVPNATVQRLWANTLRTWKASRLQRDTKNTNEIESGNAAKPKQEKGVIP